MRPVTPCSRPPAACRARSPAATGRSSRRPCARPSAASTGTTRPTPPTAAPTRCAKRSKTRISAAGQRRWALHVIPTTSSPGMKKIGNVTGNLNGGHIYGLDGLSVKTSAEGMIRGRKLAVEYTEFYRKYVPGCERIELAATSPVMGVRDTAPDRRRIRAHHRRLQRRRGSSPIRSRSTTVPPTCIRPMPRRKSSSASCRTCTAPASSRAANPSAFPTASWCRRAPRTFGSPGRCHSSDTKGARLDPRAVGGLHDGAGGGDRGGAVRSRTGAPACDLDTQALVETLRARGSYLPQDTLSRTMTRSG